MSATLNSSTRQPAACSGPTPLRPTADRRVWTAVALGFAVLAKGPVAGLLFILVAGFTYWRMPDLRPNFKGHWLAGVALFAAIVAAW